MRSPSPITRRAVLATAAAASLPRTAAAEDDPPPLFATGGQYTIIWPPRLVRSTPISTAAGDTIDLSRFDGCVVLLNFWATWCAPCVREMPSLDRLAAGTADGDIAVVPVSIEKDGCTRAVSFYRDHRLAHLDIYCGIDGRTWYRNAADATGAAFALYGLPMSYVIDRKGRARGYVTGAADWASNDAEALLLYYVREGRA